MNTYKILKDGESIESEEPGTLAGYRPGKIFGTLRCKSGARMNKENRVFFHALEDAVREGYRPCKNCKPLDEKGFESVKHLVPYASLQAFYDRDAK